MFFFIYKNTEKELGRLADFLGVKVKEQLLQEIAEKSEFRKLKEADEYVREDQKMSEILKAIGLNEKPTVYRKGKKRETLAAKSVHHTSMH